MGTDTKAVRYNYRLRVSKTSEFQLIREWHRNRWVWNQCVSEANKSYQHWKETKESVFPKFDLAKWREENDWLSKGSSMAQRQTIRKFEQAKKQAYKQPEKSHPDFKSRYSDKPSLIYTKEGIKFIDGLEFNKPYLKLAKGIIVRPVWSRELPSEPSSLTIYQDSLGHWYVSFVVKITTEPLPKTNNSIGIDPGLKTLATTTNTDLDLKKPNFTKKLEDKTKRYQRQMSRRRLPKDKAQTRGYRAAKLRYAKAHKKRTRQHQDMCHKWAKQVVRTNDNIALEDIKPGFIQASKNKSLIRSSNEAGISGLKDILQWQATKHERNLVLVDPAYTTQDCSYCDTRTKVALELSQRTFKCENCGLVIDRDRNSAFNILMRAGFNPRDIDEYKTILVEFAILEPTNVATLVPETQEIIL